MAPSLINQFRMYGADVFASVLWTGETLGSLLLGFDENLAGFVTHAALLVSMLILVTGVTCHVYDVFKRHRVMSSLTLTRRLFFSFLGAIAMASAGLLIAVFVNFIGNRVSDDTATSFKVCVCLVGYLFVPGDDIKDALSVYAWFEVARKVGSLALKRMILESMIYFTALTLWTYFVLLDAGSF